MFTLVVNRVRVMSSCFHALDPWLFVSAKTDKSDVFGTTRSEDCFASQAFAVKCIV